MIRVNQGVNLTEELGVFDSHIKQKYLRVRKTVVLQVILEFL